MACPKFTVNVKDVKAALAKVKAAIQKQNGILDGDEKKGTYNFSGSVDLWVTKINYAIKGSYTVDDKNNITITNDIVKTDSDKINCKAVEEKMREMFK
jgi:hypothetical protein